MQNFSSMIVVDCFLNLQKTHFKILVSWKAKKVSSYFYNRANIWSVIISLLDMKDLAVILLENIAKQKKKYTEYEDNLMTQIHRGGSQIQLWGTSGEQQCQLYASGFTSWGRKWKSTLFYSWMILSAIKGWVSGSLWSVENMLSFKIQRQQSWWKLKK